MYEKEKKIKQKVTIYKRSIVYETTTDNEKRHYIHKTHHKY